MARSQKTTMLPQIAHTRFSSTLKLSHRVCKKAIATSGECERFEQLVEDGDEEKEGERRGLVMWSKHYRGERPAS